MKHAKICLTQSDKNLIYKASSDRTRRIFDETMYALKLSNLSAYNYLVNITAGFKSWAQWAVTDDGFASFFVRTSNLSEENNAWLGFTLRSSNPVYLYFLFMKKTLLLFRQRCNGITDNNPNELIPSVKLYLDNMVHVSREYKVSLH